MKLLVYTIIGCNKNSKIYRYRMDMYVRNGIIGLTFIAVLSLAGLFAEERVHTVQKGETIFSIARSYNVDRNELMRFNGISDPTKLQSGQRLKIPEAPGSGSAVPAASAVSASAGNEVFHNAARGDTFYGIARRYGVTVDALLAANSLQKDYVLKQGDVLRIPGAAAPAQAGKAVQTAAGPADARSMDASVRWPVTVRELSYMTGKLSGVVITGVSAEGVKCLTRGTVISAGPYRGFGRMAIVQTEGGYYYVYGGCESLSVKEGDKVGPGTELGKLGIDAISGKPQLFFLAYRGNAPVDPAKAPRT
jgi:murein DD-endopeptidase MepM/ murein hydrolase activator NlpD